ETNLAGWYLNGWGRDNSTASGGSWSLSDSPGGNYSNDTTSYAILGPVDLARASDTYLGFSYKANISDQNDTFVVYASDDNTTWQEIYSRNTSALIWTDNALIDVGSAIDLPNSTTGDIYLNFSFTSNGTGEAEGVHIDNIIINATYPIWWTQDAEYGETLTDDVNIAILGDVEHAADLWNFNGDTGVWTCSDDSTGKYLPGMEDELRIVPLLDWRYVENISLSFEHNGQMAAGDSLFVEVTTNPNYLDASSWRTIGRVDSTSAQWDSMTISTELLPYMEEQLYLRFRFVSSETSPGATGISIGNIQIKGVVYDGSYSFSHNHYMVSTSSFYDPHISDGSYFLVRTPFGEIMTYSVSLRPGEESDDTIQYSSFNIMENPQILFVLYLIFVGLCLHFPKKYFTEYKRSLPYRYRVLAKKAAGPAVISKASALALTLFYFIPSIGSFLFISGIIFVLLGVVCVVMSAGLSLAIYNAKISEEGEFEIPSIPESEKTPAPIPTPGPIINLNVPEEKKTKQKAVRKRKKKDEKVFQCQTGGEIFSMPNDWQDEVKCPACGSAIDEKEPEEKSEEGADEREEVDAYVSQVECPACGSSIDVEGEERMEIDCPTCGKPLAILPKRIEAGYNYLFLDLNSKRSFQFFTSLLDERKGLCLTTTFPEKIRREYSVGNTEMVWITDTTSDNETAVDPRRLDFEVTRTISEATSG
ncbi:MAG: hypothetical protein KAT70_04640, partial [Thermoplasmata archaeon]|nr:hypothetical protein [Thermoplasmata archaeon]